MSLELQIRDSDSTTQPFFWRVVVDGDVWAKSETYVEKRDAVEAAELLKKYANTTHVSLETFQTIAGKWRWRAKAGNYKKLVSATDDYDSWSAANAAKNWIESNAWRAEIKDMTRTGYSRRF